MKTKRFICSFSCVLALVACLFAGSINADAQEYFYKVKIHLADSDLDGDGKGDAGAYFISDDGVTLKNNAVTIISGTSKESSVKMYIDGDTFVIDNLRYGDRVIFDKDAAIAVPNEEDTYTKYFAKGIRQSGMNDFNKNSTLSSFEIKKDVDYVVAYSVGTIVPYLVRYVDEDGNALLEDQIYYGPLDEAVSVAYKYVPGYVPNTYNYFTGKLAGPTTDEDGTVHYTTFEFKYSKGSANTVITDTVYENEGYRYVYVDGGYDYVTVNDGAGGNAGGNAAGGNAAGGNAEGGNADGQDANADDGAATIGDEQTPAAGPADVIDIDDEATPLAGAIKENAVPIALIAIAVIAAVAIIVLAVLLLKKNKKKKAITVEVEKTEK